MRGGGLFAAIAVVISILCACNGHAAATPALPVSNAALRTLGMLTDIPDAKSGEKLYIANLAANNIETFTSAGKSTKPTITKGVNDPGIIAVNSKGNIFVPNYYDDTVTTYESNGKQTKPTISVGLNEPTGVTVDAKGKIYVTNAFTSNVTTYKPNGQQTTPTIANIDGPRGIAVDAKGKIYVANFRNEHGDHVHIGREADQANDHRPRRARWHRRRQERQNLRHQLLRQHAHDVHG